MLLLLLNILFLFVFVAIVYLLMRRKDSDDVKNIFDHYTQLGVLITFTLVMINCIVLLDSDSKLPLFSIIALTADIISPFWVPFFFYLIKKKVNNNGLRKSLQLVTNISFALVILTYSIFFTSII